MRKLQLNKLHRNLALMKKQMSDKPFRLNTKAMALLLCAGVLMSSVSVTFAWFGSTFENLNTEIRMGDFSADISVYDVNGAEIASRKAENGDTVSFDNTVKNSGWASGDVSAYYIYVDNSGEIDIKSYLSFTSEFVSETASYPENKEHFAFNLVDITEEAEKANGLVNYISSAKLPSAETVYNNGSTFNSTDSVPAGALESGDSAAYVLYFCCYDIPNEFVSSEYSFNFNTKIMTTQAGAPENATIPTDEELKEIAVNLTSGIVEETTAASTTTPATQPVTAPSTDAKPTADKDKNAESVKGDWVWKYNNSNKVSATLLEYNGTDKTVTIPAVAGGAVVTTLANNLFAESKAETVIVPATIRYFENDTFTSEKLKNVQFQKKTQASGKVYSAAYTSDSKAIYSADMTSLVRYLPQTSGQSFVVPAEVKAIYDYAFNKCNMLEVLTVKNVSVVTSKTFKGSGIKTFKFYGSETITTVGNNVFGDKTKATIYVLEAMKKEYANSSVFNGYKVRYELVFDVYESSLVTVHNGLEYVIMKSGSEYNGVKYTSDRYNEFVIVTAFKVIPTDGVVKLPDTIISNDKVYNVAAIADGAFAGCKDLKSIVLPDADVSFTTKAFTGCTSLETIVFGNIVKDEPVATVVTSAVTTTVATAVTTEETTAESTQVASSIETEPTE